ncbi:MAG: hypothetical protein WD579_03200 [Candidatus Paceibacterota bacterium]
MATRYWFSPKTSVEVDDVKRLDPRKTKKYRSRFKSHLSFILRLNILLFFTGLFVGVDWEIVVAGMVLATLILLKVWGYSFLHPGWCKRRNKGDDKNKTLFINPFSREFFLISPNGEVHRR